jgi:hypothetical protein
LFSATFHPPNLLAAPLPPTPQEEKRRREE